MTNNTNNPSVSICCLAYNHKQFIRKALDSFLMQQTDFAFEILIHDDASTDGTSEVIREYQEKNPHIIKPIYQTENQWSKGIHALSAIYNFSRANGKYIAMCEGDDYWTDALKLQKQVDFLENNPDFMLTCGGFVKSSDGVTEEIIINGVVSSSQEDEAGFRFTLEDLLKRWVTKTLTCTFRNTREVFSYIHKYKHARDIHIYYHILKKGGGYYFKQLFGVYTIHDGGVFSFTAERTRLTTHYNIYQELYAVNRDEFARKMYFKLLLKIVNFNLSNSRRSDFNTVKTVIEAIKLISNARDFLDFLKVFIPRKIKRAVKSNSRA